MSFRGRIGLLAEQPILPSLRDRWHLHLSDQVPVGFRTREQFQNSQGIARSAGPVGCTQAGPIDDKRRLRRRLGRHQRFACNPFVSAPKTGQRAFASDSESQQHRPQHRAGIDPSSSSNRSTFMGPTLDLRFRQHGGQCLSNANILVSGHGHPPDLLKPSNSNLIRGRGTLQVSSFLLIPPLSEHGCASPKV